jgi:3-dehydroquinate synthase
MRARESTGLLGPNEMTKIGITLSGTRCDVCVGPGLHAQAGRWLRELGFGGRLAIITDSVVKELYGGALEQHLTTEGFKVFVLEVGGGEEQKSLQTALGLYNQLSDVYAERTTPILALGGGVIGDLSGFVAATYLRGVPLVQMPTTLLAQVDSSIGGKVAVNHGQLKNRIGAFYQPSLVISDTATLGTLGARELSNGLAEVIKSAVVWDKELFAYLENNIGRIRTLDGEALEETVVRTVRIKTDVVERDEKDLNLRNILNYGHTIGHAIETTSDFEIGHGEAVAIGMVAAARISNEMGVLGRDHLARLRSLIERAGLPTGVPVLEAEAAVQAMGHDKKIHEGKLRFILPRAIGDVFITDEVSPRLIERVLTGSSDEEA